MFRRLKAPSLSGFGVERLWSDLARRRYRHRQFVTIAYVMLLSLVGRPSRVPMLYWAGVALVFAGEAIRMWASGHVRKDRVLATAGPYAYVRHPLYVGNNMIVVGFCLVSGLWWSFPLWLVLALVFFPQAIAHEDAQLHRQFGLEWERWRADTRALLPRLTPSRSASGGRWSLRQSLRVNGEPFIAAFLGGCFWMLYLRMA